MEHSPEANAEDSGATRVLPGRRRGGIPPAPAPIAWRREALPLLAVLLGVATAHCLFAWATPDPRLWGDEEHYAALAREDVAQGTTSLLPGTLRFEHRPEFGSRVWAQLASAEIADTALLARASVLHGALLLVLLVLVYAQARRLSLRPGSARLAAGMLGLFPWFGFYVHALWPEMLHATFAALLFLSMLVVLTRGPLWVLVPGGVALGFALLTKGSLNLFVPLLLATAAIAGALFAPAEADARRRLLRGALAAAALALPTLAVLAPQLAANAAEGHGANLAANRWRNLEMGLRSYQHSQVEPSEGLPTVSRRDLIARHRADARPWAEREVDARDRTLAFLAEANPFLLLRAQVTKVSRLLFTSDSSFDKSLEGRGRWQPKTPGWLSPLRAVARAGWYALLGLAALGLTLTCTRSLAWGWIALYVVYFGAALLAIPLKLRFAMPLVPVLCLLAAAAIDRATASRAARAAGRGSEPALPADSGSSGR